MVSKGKGWHKDSRRHSLARKGISTVLPDGRRLPVNKYLAGGRKKETEELREFLKSYMKGSEIYQQDPYDVNHPFQCWYRLMMDGSYKGYDYYKRIQERVNESNGNEKKLRSIAIQISMDALQEEFPELSRSTIQRNVVDVFGDNIDKVNDNLIEDLKDFAKDHNMDWAMRKASGKRHKYDDKKIINTLSKLSLSELRRRQDINNQQIEMASKQRNDDALADLQVKDWHYTMAVFKREYPEDYEYNMPSYIKELKASGNVKAKYSPSSYVVAKHKGKNIVQTAGSSYKKDGKTYYKIPAHFETGTEWIEVAEEDLRPATTRQAIESFQGRSVQ